MEIKISDQIREACPQLALVLITANVDNTKTAAGLQQELDIEIEKIKGAYLLEGINKRPAIAATRKAYKHLGKDPNRYRPSAEALCRRIVRGIPVYRISTLVDIINLVSIRSGFSICGFDLEKFQGEIELGEGTTDDYFEAIGRDVLNVENLPLYRDRVGGIGTPTSDHERTKITGETTRLLMIINGFGGNEGLEEATAHALHLLQEYAGLQNVEITRIG